MKRRYKIVLVLAAAFSALLLWIPYGQHCDSQQSNQYYCAAYSVALIVGSYIESHNGAITALASVVVAIFTWTLWASSERMWLVTDASLQHSRETAERQLRAYITVQTGEAYRQRGGPKGWRFEFRPTILNTGQTPAYSVNIRGTVVFLSTEEAENFNWEDNLPPTAKVGVLTLGTQQNRFTRAVMSRRLTRAELRQFSSGSHDFYVFGKVTYQDTFRIDHSTRYCFALAKWHKRGAHTWLTTYRYNDSD